MFDEVSDRVVDARSDHVVLGLVALQHAPHRVDEVGRVTPVAARVEVAEHQLRRQAQLDRGGRVGDLAGDELEAAAGALVIEEDPRAGVEAVALPVVDRYEVRVDLGDAVGAAGIEGRQLVLRGFPHFAEHLARRGLVEAGVRARFPHRLEHPRHADPGELRGQRGLVPGCAHERHRRQVVDLLRLAGPHHVAQGALVEEVAGVDRYPVPKRLQAMVVLAREAPDHAVDLVPLVEEKLGQVAAVLARYAGDQRAARHRGQDYPAAASAGGISGTSRHISRRRGRSGRCGRGLPPGWPRPD